jgi:hypothetical protein
MKTDWFGTFLPFWMWGTIGWMAIGFTLMPEAFRRPLFVDKKEVWVPQIYDATDIDGEIALKLCIILVLPMAVGFVAMMVAVMQERRARRLAREVAS